MRKKIRFYKQHTMRTCGAACMLMILDLYRKVDYPTEKQEMNLYSRYRSKAYLAINGAAIANCLSGKGLAVHLMQSFSQKMDNRDDYFSEELYHALVEEYQVDLNKCADRIRLTREAEINCDTLRQELDAGRQIILQCMVPGDADGIHDHVLHWIVVYGYEKNEFLVCDPLCSKIRLTDTELEHFMDTAIGRMCIVVGENHD